MDLVEWLLLVILVPAIVLSFIPEKKWPKPTPKLKRRKYRNSSDGPKTLPWFDKDYLKRREEEKRKNTIRF